MNFGTRLRELRNQKGLGLREAARLASVDPGLWSKYESSIRTPPKTDGGEEVIQRIAATVTRGIGSEEYHELVALAKLPEGTPGPLVRSYKNYLARTYKGRS